MFLKQMQVGHMAIFAYIVGDLKTGDALAIDPAANCKGIIKLAQENNLVIKYIVNTHGHVDHVSGNTEMKKKTGAQIVIHKGDAELLLITPPAVFRMFGAEQSPPADITVNDGDCIKVGDISLQVIHTPGHTPGGMSLYTEGYVFTGDTLFVEAVGRTDLPGGSWPVMHRSITTRLFTLPDDTKVLPGHNYGRMPTSTIGHEKMYNPYIR